MRWGFGSLVCMVVARAAAAQPAEPAAEPAEPPPSPPSIIGYGALPGGIVVPSAELVPKGAVEVGTIDGFGYRKGLLGPSETMSRVLGDIAAAYGITDLIAVALSLDGRYDRHTGGNPSPDDGYVGDPHVLGRVTAPAGTARIGGQLGIWIPGRNAPSIAGSAISVDLRALISLAVGPGTLSFEGGFQLDNSSASVDDPSKLSLADRTSLGVSDFDEAFGGANISIPLAGNKAWIDGEISLDAYVGNAPTTAGHAPLEDGSLTLRGGISAGYHLTNEWALLAFVQAAKSPYITAAQVSANAIPLVPYEPNVTGGIGLSARFGGPSSGQGQVKGCAYTAAGCPAVEAPILADITGTVVDEAGKPVVGAKVSIQLKNVTIDPVATDGTGGYVWKGVRIGTKADASGGRPALHRIDETTAEIHVDVDGKKPGTSTLGALVEGANAVPPIKLEPALPPGQLRGVIHALPTGKPVDHATITIEPGGQKVESGADGTFQLDLAPGTYKLTVKATGFAPQELPFVIDPNGVAIKNIDLHK